jgi:hypothetical protein
VHTHGPAMRQLIVCTRQPLHAVATAVTSIQSESTKPLIEVAQIYTLANSFKTDVNDLLKQCTVVTEQLPAGVTIVHTAAYRALSSVLSSLNKATTRHLHAELLHEVVRDLSTTLQQLRETSNAVAIGAHCEQSVATALHGSLVYVGFSLVSTPFDLTTAIITKTTEVNVSTLDAAFVSDTLLRGMLEPLLRVVQSDGFPYPDDTEIIIRQLWQGLAAIPCDTRQAATLDGIAVNHAVKLLTGDFVNWIKRCSELTGSADSLNYLTTTAHMLAQ